MAGNQDNTYKVLLVEDDAGDIELIRRKLAAAVGPRFEIEYADRLSVAIQRLDRGGIDVVLLDLSLPESQGFETFQRVFRRFPDVPIVILTGGEDDRLASTAIQEGAQDYLRKYELESTMLDRSLRYAIERKQSEEALRKSESEFRLLAENVPDLFAYIGRDQRYRFVNRHYEGLFEMPRSKIVGLHLRDVVGLEAYSVIKEHVETVLSGTKLSFEAALSIKSALPRWMSTTYVPHVLNNNQVDGYFSLMSDITVRKRTEQQLLQSERLSAIGQMVTGLAHESRNALQRSQASLSMLSHRVEDNPEMKELVSHIQSAQDYLHQLHEQVRNYAAPIRLHPTQCYLPGIVDEAWADVTAVGSDDQGSLQQQTGGLELRATVDEFAVRQIFRNLFENALSFSGEPAEVHVVWSKEMAESGPAYRIAISDNGPGLTAEQHERLFEPFFTTKTHGTGLGMAIVKRLVLAHHGTIEVGTRISHGAEIIITIPLQRADTQ